MANEGALPRAPALRVATYNIHACVGVDRRYDPARVAAVLREIDADIVCLQEVDARRKAAPQGAQWAYLGAATNRRAIVGAGVPDRPRRLGNVILTRFPVLAVRTIDLTVSGYPSRGAVDADLLVGDRLLRVVATHFGLLAGERLLQVNRMMNVLAETPPRPAGWPRAQALLLMGDLNEWRGRGGAIRSLDRRLGPSAAPKTFPSWMPMLPLDRIYAAGSAMLAEISAYRSPLSRLASDHLPLVARLLWDEGVLPAR
jgi:endonuclease/exonuclease/phosphatase family metal-dependent hydrolase